MANLNIYIDYRPSIKEMFETLGLKRNIYSFESKKDLTNEIRDSINNLKDYIRQFKVFTSQIRFRLNSNTSHPILKYYMNKIDILVLKNNNKVVFDKNDIMLKFEKIKIKQIEDLININKYELRELTESYSKLLDYLYSELLLLIEFNSNKYIKLQLIFFILSLTNYFYNINYNQYTNFDLLRYNYILNTSMEIQEVRDSAVEDFDDIILENETNVLTEDDEENIKNLENDNEEQFDALDAEQEEYDEEEGGEQVLFTND